MQTISTPIGAVSENPYLKITKITIDSINVVIEFSIFLSEETRRNGLIPITSGVQYCSIDDINGDIYNNCYTILKQTNEACKDSIDI